MYILDLGGQGNTMNVTGGTIYGAIMLSREGGGYVLAAVIAFVLGVVITMLTRRYREQPHDNTVTRMTRISESALGAVAGGASQGDTVRSSVEDGTCPICGRTRYRVTVSQYTDNGPWEHTYYECDQCGPL